MAAHYHAVTLEEMTAFLEPQGFKIVNGTGKRLRDLSSTVEIVFGKRIDTDGQMLTLRVFTGINPSGESRGVGEDAIRVSLAQKLDNGTREGKIATVGGSRRVHRVAGWRKNLANRLDRWQEQVGPQCPKCSALMVEREGKNGKFWGCTQYDARSKTGCSTALPYNIEADAPHCPRCDKLMVRRKGRDGDFYGCTGYPECRGTLNIEEEDDDD